MDLDLETGYHMSNMENIDIMSLLLNRVAHIKKVIVLMTYFVLSDY